MDGHKSLLLILALAMGCTGCITSHEQKVTLRGHDDPAPFAAPIKEEAKKPAPPRVLIAMAEMREREADLAKDRPETQARMRDEARRAYQELLKNDPDNIDGYRGLARVYTSMGDYDRAADTYKKALAKNPREVNLWHDFGIMHDRRRDWAEGARCFQKALEFDPENQHCLKALGFTLARAGQIDQSMIYLTRAMGSTVAAHTNVALMLLHVAEQEPGNPASRQELARQHLHMALQENPNYERARELLASLDGQATIPTRGTVEIQFDAGQ